MASVEHRGVPVRWEEALRRARRARLGFVLGCVCRLARGGERVRLSWRVCLPPILNPLLGVVFRGCALRFRVRGALEEALSVSRRGACLAWVATWLMAGGRSGGCALESECRSCVRAGCVPSSRGVCSVGVHCSGYLVDPASSHMLVSKIKPCMSKYKRLYCETANGTLNQLWFI